MVDPVGFRPVTLTPRLGPVAPTAPVRGVESATSAVATTHASSLTQSAASSAPVNAERVAEIKKAIADGNFPLVPSTVADRLLALKLQWNPNEQA